MIFSSRVSHLTFTTLGLLLFAVSAEGGITYHVRQEGGGDCTTINACLGRLQPGDTLYVHAGTYIESLLDYVTPIPSGTSWSNPVTIAAYPGETVALRPDSGYYVIYVGTGHSYISIEGFRVDGRNVGASLIQFEDADHIRLKNIEVKNGSYNGIWTSGSHNEFINVHVHDNGFTVYEGTGGCWYGMYMHGNNHLIENSSFHKNGGYGIHIYDNDVRNHNNIIRNNTLYDNGYCGVGHGGGMILTKGTGNMAYNNVIWGNKTGGIIVAYNVSNTSVYNNTVYANGLTDPGRSFGGIYIEGSSSHASIRNNIVYNNAGGEITNDGSNTTLSDNLTTDPRFVNSSTSDFHLQASSPAIDAGVSLPDIPTDFDGVSRPQGSGYDIGACEFKVGGTLRGDLNGDGKRDLADVRLLIYMLLGQQPTTPEADLTGDGAVTLADVQALIRLLVGLP